ncbi:hypothetical protein D6764_01420 [Candidatus Woesearchaeota archaeon]|nr:MAG: hypothetical protein D6764_01420 [Candidatus Woesearchaeota archaeon]
MNMTIQDRLRKKGWSEEEIEKAVRIMKEAEDADKPSLIKLVDKALYWAALFLALLGNFVVSVVLIPFLLALTHYQLYVSIIVIATSFGMLFMLLIKDIDNLTPTHYIVAGAFLPAVAAINAVIITKIANMLIPIMRINNTEKNPYVIGIIYGVCFLIPYLISDSVHKFMKERVSKTK